MRADLIGTHSAGQDRVYPTNRQEAKMWDKPVGPARSMFLTCSRLIRRIMLNEIKNLAEVSGSAGVYRAKGNAERNGEDCQRKQFLRTIAGDFFQRPGNGAFADDQHQGHEQSQLAQRDH